jgi:DNA repair exonuclease SbcCD ATPase subunit
VVGLSEVEEVKREIEELPDEVEEARGAEAEVKPEEVEQQPDYERLIEEFRRRKELVREVVEFAKEVSSLSPEQVSVATQILDRILPRAQPKPQVITVEKPVPVEKPVVQTVTVEKPVPVVPEGVEGKLASVEARLSEIDRKLTAYNKVLERVTALSESTVSLATELARVREELERVKEDQRKIVEGLKEQVMVVPKTKIRRQDGTEVEEYDWHPRLKYIERQADFAFSQLGPALITEIRAARADISSHLTRLISLVESIMTPELRRRAPRIVEEIEDKLRRLVGGVAPEERERVLAELEQKVSQLMQSQTASGEQK